MFFSVTVSSGAGGGTAARQCHLWVLHAYVGQEASEWNLTFPLCGALSPHAYT